MSSLSLCPLCLSVSLSLCLSVSLSVCLSLTHTSNPIRYWVVWGHSLDSLQQPTKDHTLKRKLTLPSPSHQVSRAPHPGMETHESAPPPFWDADWLTLYRSCASNHSSCEFTSAGLLSSLERHCLGLVLVDFWLFEPSLKWSLSFDGKGYDLDVLFMAEHFIHVCLLSALWAVGDFCINYSPQRNFSDEARGLHYMWV